MNTVRPSSPRVKIAKTKRAKLKLKQTRLKELKEIQGHAERITKNEAKIDEIDDRLIDLERILK